MNIEDKLNIVDSCKKNEQDSVLAYLIEKVDLNLLDSKEYMKLYKRSYDMVLEFQVVADIFEDFDANKEAYSREEMEKIVEYIKIKENKYDFEIFEAFLIGLEQGYRMSSKFDFNEKTHYE
jgi:hypothetical protein